MNCYRIHNKKETDTFGQKLASIIKPGDILCLCGDLGAGKTTLSKSIIKGLGVRETVTSPTFTIVHEYQGRLPVYHFDVYRINEAEEMYEIGCDEYFFGEGVCIIEWADKIKEILPDSCIWVTIQYDDTAENEEGRIYITDI